MVWNGMGQDRIVNWRCLKKILFFPYFWNLLSIQHCFDQITAFFQAVPKTTSGLWWTAGDTNGRIWMTRFGRRRQTMLMSHFGFTYQPPRPSRAIGLLTSFAQPMCWIMPAPSHVLMLQFTLIVRLKGVGSLVECQSVPLLTGELPVIHMGSVMADHDARLLIV